MARPVSVVGADFLWGVEGGVGENPSHLIAIPRPRPDRSVCQKTSELLTKAKNQNKPARSATNELLLKTWKPIHTLSLSLTLQLSNEGSFQTGHLLGLMPSLSY